MLHRNNKTYLTSDGTLISNKLPAKNEKGLDNFGSYQQYLFNLNAIDNSIGMDIYFKIYNNLNFVIFGAQLQTSMVLLGTIF